MLVTQRRGPDYESETALSGSHQGLQVRGRADGFDPDACQLDEVKTFRGALERMAPNHQALHWAQLKVYGWLMCESRRFQHISLSLIYLDVADQSPRVPLVHQSFKLMLSISASFIIVITGTCTFFTYVLIMTAL